MGVKDWILIYADGDGDVRGVLRTRPQLDRAATRAFVEELYPGFRITETADGNLWEDTNPPEGQVYAACFPGVSVVCTADVYHYYPSRLRQQFRKAAAGRTLYLHGMDRVDDWVAYAIWTGDGELRRALSVNHREVFEDIGTHLPFEAPFWAGDGGPVDDETGEAILDPVPFYQNKFGEYASLILFGFGYEYGDGAAFDAEDITLAGFAVEAPENAVKLWTEDGSIAYDPELPLIQSMLRDLSEGNVFGILERPDGRFMQTSAWDADRGIWALEHQEGAIDRQYRVELQSMDGVAEAFDEFARGEDGWKARYEWTKLHLGSPDN